MTSTHATVTFAQRFNPDPTQELFHFNFQMVSLKKKNTQHILKSMVKEEKKCQMSSSLQSQAHWTECYLEQYICLHPPKDVHSQSGVPVIIDVYPGSSTYPKVVFKEVLHPIELEFGNADF